MMGAFADLLTTWHASGMTVEAMIAGLRAVEDGGSHDLSKELRKERNRRYYEAKRAVTAEEIKTPSRLKKEAVKTPKRLKASENVLNDGGDQPAKKGTRLPLDWFLPKTWGEEALAIGLTRDEVRREAAQFKDHWHAKAGQDASKLDWRATWRNWCRNALSRRPRSFGAPAPMPAPVTTDTVGWAKRMEAFGKTGKWHPSWGPAPGEAGCEVPAALIPAQADLREAG